MACLDLGLQQRIEHMILYHLRTASADDLIRFALPPVAMNARHQFSFQSKTIGSDGVVLESTEGSDAVEPGLLLADHFVYYTIRFRAGSGEAERGIVCAPDQQSRRHHCRENRIPVPHTCGILRCNCISNSITPGMAENNQGRNPWPP